MPDQPRNVEITEGWMLRETCRDTDVKHEMVVNSTAMVVRCAGCGELLWMVNQSFDGQHLNQLVSVEQFVIQELP